MKNLNKLFIVFMILGLSLNSIDARGGHGGHHGGGHHGGRGHHGGHHGGRGRHDGWGYGGWPLALGLGYAAGSGDGPTYVTDYEDYDPYYNDDDIIYEIYEEQ